VFSPISDEHTQEDIVPEFPQIVVRIIIKLILKFDSEDLFVMQELWYLVLRKIFVLLQINKMIITFLYRLKNSTDIHCLVLCFVTSFNNTLHVSTGFFSAKYFFMFPSR